MIAEKKGLVAKSVIFSIVLSFFLFSAVIFPCLASETETDEIQAPEASQPSYSQQAAFIAGVSTPSSPLAQYEKRTAWKQFAGFFDRAWKSYDTKQLKPMRKWAATELAAPISSRLTVYYPLSGPDFVNAYTLFPRARTYILVALEPVGEIPDFQAMSPEELNAYFADLKQSLHDLCTIHYFLSSHLGATLEGEKVRGVLPLLMFFLGREKANVLDIERWYMEWDGTIVTAPAFGESEPAPENAIHGVRISFKTAGPAGEPQTIYYFKLNLYNSTFNWNRRFIGFLRSFGPLVTFMKSASYVMFDPHFSAARQFVLNRSRYVLQGDSGIPFDCFDPSLWDIRLYGVYTKPVSAFKEDYQADLAEAYRADKDVKFLPFGIDYHWEVNTANLLLAIKK